MVTCLKDFIDHKEIVKQAVSAIVAMSSFKSDSSKKEFQSIRTCDTLSLAMLRYSSDRNIVVPGLWAMELLAPL